jgi:hypothetical protein
MSDTKDGGPAFPRLTGLHGDHVRTPNYRAEVAGGMSLRDWFAGQALAGYASVPDPRTAPSGKEIAEWCAEVAGQDASYCYMLADAMLAERDKR